MKFNKISVYVLLAALPLTLALLRCKLLWEPEFVEVPCPTLLDFTPDGAFAGDTVTLLGSNFEVGCPELYQILLAGKAVPRANLISVPDDNRLLFVVPGNTQNGTIEVSLANQAGCGSSPTKRFSYYYTATKVGNLAGTLQQNTCPISPTSNFFDTPAGLDFNKSTGQVIVADRNHHLIRVVTPSATIGATGSMAATHGKFNVCLASCDPNTVFLSSNASFNLPVDVAVDTDGSLYVMESGSAVIRLIKPIGSVEVYAGRCGESAPVTNNSVTRPNARLNLPMGIAKDGNDIFFVDAGNIRKIDASDLVLTWVTKPVGSNFRSIEVSRSRPGEGPVFVTDAATKTIRYYTDDGVAGQVQVRNTNNMSYPSALTIDSKGNIFIADRDAHQVFVIYPNGEMRTLAGSSTPNYVNDVPGYLARFDQPLGIAIDEDKGIVYVSDSRNHLVRYILLE